MVATENARDILPTNVQPVHYDLHLIPNLEAFTFSGTVSIEINVKEETSEIVLNAVEQELQSAVLLSNGAVVQSASSIVLDEKAQTATIKFASKIKVSELVLKIEFTGIINDNMAGFYRSGYEDESGKKLYIGVTQFEATDARRAFPCWDEPALKATFSISIKVKKGLSALSNMNVLSEKPHGDLQEFVFAKTPIMSTYLVAYVVGDLEYIESKSGDIQVRVYAIKGKLGNQGDFALKVCCETLAFFAKYFDTPYPLPKMDMIAIPDFSAGAMENWGLVTYRNVYILFDPEQSSVRTKQNVAYVVGHELAHQWFGNLVTMDWWSDLWLNEGFATWVGWLAVDNMFPEWDIWTQFIMDDTQRGFNLDSLLSSHPIEVPVKNPSEISQIFDAISYSKGASVIRMLVSYLGENDFKNGIRAYLKKHMYGNACTVDLWNSLAAASKKPVAEMMASWTLQMGYPFVTVEGDSKTLSFTQNRFLSSGSPSEEDNKSLWQIPLGISHSSMKDRKSCSHSNTLLSERSMTIELPGACQKDGKDVFFKLNGGQHGFYRVKYSESLLRNLGQALSSVGTDGKPVLPTTDRIGIISDIFALATAGFEKTSSALSILMKYKNEEDYIVWAEVATKLKSIQNTWWQEPTEVQEKIKNLIVALCKKQVEILGFEPHPESDKLSLLQNLVIAAAGRNGDKSVIKECQDRFEKLIAGDESAVHANLRGVVYSIAIQNGDESTWEQVKKIYLTSTVADQKMTALSALGDTHNPVLIEKLLKMVLDPEIIRNQDAIVPFASISSSAVGRPLAWAFFKENFQVFYDRYYKYGTALLSRLVSISSNELASPEWKKDVEDFFKSLSVDTSAISRSINQSLEKIDTSSKWLSRDRDDVIAWLRANSQ